MSRPSINCHELVTFDGTFLAINLGMGGYHEHTGGTVPCVNNMWNSNDYNMLLSSYNVGFFKGSQKRSVKSMLKKMEKEYEESVTLRKVWECTPYYDYMLPSHVKTVMRHITINNDSIRDKYKNFGLSNGNYIWYSIGMLEDLVDSIINKDRYLTEADVLQMTDYQSAFCSPSCEYKNMKTGNVVQKEETNFMASWGSTSDYIVIIMPIGLERIINDLEKGIKHGCIAFVSTIPQICRMCGAILVNLEEAYLPRVSL